MSALTSLVFSDPVELYAAQDLEKGCGDPLIEQRGVAAWRAWLLQNVGGTDLGIVRACNVGGPSEHKTGRAFDWGNNALDDAERARADDLIADLLRTDNAGNDAAIFRRLGLMYIIWNRQVWSVRTKSWQPYTGQSPHTDHVHFSFGWPGARAQTSFFRAIGVAPDYSRLGGDAPGALTVAALVTVGIALGFYGSRLVATELLG